MIKSKDINVPIDNIAYRFGIDYEASDGEIVAVCINDADILPLIRESVLNRITDVFYRGLLDE